MRIPSRKELDLLRDECFRRFVYDEAAGILRNKSNGKRAGNSDKYGRYHTVMVLYKNYREHRLIWLMINNEWPELIDHINRNPLDNRLSNLRVVDKSINGLNTDRGVTNRGFGNKPWRVVFNVREEVRIDETFATEEEAIRRREDLLKQYNIRSK